MKAPFLSRRGNSPFEARKRSAATGARYLKKSYQHLFARPSVKFQFIVEHSQQYSVTLLCHALDVSVSDYYAWCQREVSEHQREDARLSAEIQQIELSHRQVYGSPITFNVTVC
jgi:hypothetical protein